MHTCGSCQTFYTIVVIDNFNLNIFHFYIDVVIFGIFERFLTGMQKSDEAAGRIFSQQPRHCFKIIPAASSLFCIPVAGQC